MYMATCDATGKVRHKRKKEAERTAAAVAPGTSWHAYYCRHCQGWHWSRRPLSVFGSYDDGSGAPRERDPWVLVAAETARVRAYSMGPGNRDWLCVECGAVSKQPGARRASLRKEAVRHLQRHVVSPLIQDAPLA